MTYDSWKARQPDMPSAPQEGDVPHDWTTRGGVTYCLRCDQDIDGADEFCSVPPAPEEPEEEPWPEEDDRYYAKALHEEED